MWSTVYETLCICVSKERTVEGSTAAAVDLINHCIILTDSYLTNEAIAKVISYIVLVNQLSYINHMSHLLWLTCAETDDNTWLLNALSPFLSPAVLCCQVTPTADPLQYDNTDDSSCLQLVNHIKSQVSIFPHIR